MTQQEYEAILSFTQWYKDIKPRFLNAEFVVWGDGYAGTIDLLCKIGQETYIVDFKTSQNIWPAHELQLSAYSKAIQDNKNWKYEEPKLAILQVGYQRNKQHYKFTEIEDQYELFLAAKQIWAKETKGIAPLERDYPLSVKLTPEKEKTNARPKQTVKVSQS